MQERRRRDGGGKKESGDDGGIMVATAVAIAARGRRATRRRDNGGNCKRRREMMVERLALPRRNATMSETRAAMESHLSGNDDDGGEWARRAFGQVWRRWLRDVVWASDGKKQGHVSGNDDGGDGGNSGDVRRGDGKWNKYGAIGGARWPLEEGLLYIAPSYLGRALPSFLGLC
ncbi:hypothetical protein CPB85DRAFT_1252935 [Mucidula mucida]|nr:hypothetical protein CPB85DRAFT_1252935 [Mucidula mucida]